MSDNLQIFNGIVVSDSTESSQDKPFSLDADWEFLQAIQEIEIEVEKVSNQVNSDNFFGLSVESSGMRSDTMQLTLNFVSKEFSHLELDESISRRTSFRKLLSITFPLFQTWETENATYQHSGGGIGSVKMKHGDDPEVHILKFSLHITLHKKGTDIICLPEQ
jgi:hypothetical protein